MVMGRSYEDTFSTMFSALGVGMVCPQFQCTISLGARPLMAGLHHCSPYTMHSSLHSCYHQHSHSQFSEQYLFACWL